MIPMKLFSVRCELMQCSVVIFTTKIERIETVIATRIKSVNVWVKRFNLGFYHAIDQKLLKNDFKTRCVYIKWYNLQNVQIRKTVWFIVKSIIKILVKPCQNYFQFRWNYMNLSILKQRWWWWEIERERKQSANMQCKQKVTKLFCLQWLIHQTNNII